MKSFLNIVLLLVITTVSFSQSQIIQGEYFWDTDPGEGNGMPILALDGNFDEVLEDLYQTGISIASLTQGAHVFNVRVKSNDGSWSNPFKQVIVKEGPLTLLTRTIQVTQGEYFWDIDPGEGSGTPILALDGSFDETLEDLYQTGISIASLAQGAHLFNVRVKGNDGSWSNPFKQVIYINAPLCKVYDTIVDSICNGETYTFGSQIITTAGNYNDTIVVVNNCDTVRTLVLKVNSLVTPTISIFTNVSLPVCKGESIVFSSSTNHGGNAPLYQWKRNGNNVGTGLNTYSPPPTSNQDGDTIICLLTTSAYCATSTLVSDTVVLKINPLIKTNIIDSLCSGDSLFFGGNYIKNYRIYTDTLTTSKGCDSVVELNLIARKALKVFANSDTNIIGAGGTIIFSSQGSNASNYSWDFGDGNNSTLDSVSHTYNTPGLYTVILKGTKFGECSNQDTLTIEVLNSVGINETVNSNSFSVYPNPSNGMLNIITIETLSNATITIRNITGQTVASYNFGALNATSIELNNVAGIYFVEVAAVNFKKTVKVIKQ